MTPHGYLLLPPPTIFLAPILAALVPPIVIAIGAFLHSRRAGSRIGLVVLGAGTVALLLATIFSVIALLHLFLLPSLVLALVACALAFRNGQRLAAIAAGQALS